VAHGERREEVVGSREEKLGYLSLFTSLGTLVCCALPSLLVLLGLGATVASFLSVAPWLVTLSRHKQWVFTVSGVFIATNFLYVYRIAPRLQAEGAACAPDHADACATASRLSRFVLWISAVIYGIGFFTAFLLGRILIRLDP
jgi:hypothetical protein